LKIEDDRVAGSNREKQADRNGYCEFYAVFHVLLIQSTNRKAHERLFLLEPGRPLILIKLATLNGQIIDISTSISREI
jgi:hypothetical protein